MWGKEKVKKVDLDQHAGRTTLIAKGTTINGNIEFEGGLLVEGTVHGNLYAAEGTDSLLRISEAGVIEGEIHVPNVVINGSVTGDVYSGGHIELAAKAAVHGNVHYNLIEMVVGSQVNGSLLHCQQSRVETATSQVQNKSDPDGNQNLPSLESEQRLA